jgi:hypothetical protein
MSDKLERKRQNVGGVRAMAVYSSAHGAKLTIDDPAPYI